jgi:two-component system response regulator YesN
MHIRVNGQADRSTHFKDVQPQTQFITNRFFDAEKLAVTITLGSKDEFARMLELIFNKDEQEGLCKVKAISMEILNLIARTAESRGVAFHPFEQRVRLIEHILSLGSRQEIIQAISSQVYYVMDEIQELRFKRSQHVVSQAKNYINTYFKNEISLESIAAHVYLTPNYFGSLFKKEMGMTCVEYLTRVRIDYAKRLLDTSQRSLQSISEEAGFRDANYFSQVFKKMESMNPSQYRKRSENGF